MEKQKREQWIKIYKMIYSGDPELPALGMDLGLGLVAKLREHYNPGSEDHGTDILIMFNVLGALETQERFDKLMGYGTKTSKKTSKTPPVKRRRTKTTRSKGNL